MTAFDLPHNKVTTRAALHEAKWDEPPLSFQKRVGDWMLECFGLEIAEIDTAKERKRFAYLVGNEFIMSLFDEIDRLKVENAQLRGEEPWPELDQASKTVRGAMVRFYAGLHKRTRAEALEEAARFAKTAWLSDVGTIGDADYGEALCAAIDQGIRAIASGGREKK